MVCGRRECCCEDQLKRAGHRREGEAEEAGPAPERERIGMLARPFSGPTHFGGTSLVFPQNAHASCLAPVPAAPAPHPLQLSEVQPQWFPTHVACWPNIEMIQSAVGEQPAGCPESS